MMPLHIRQILLLFPWLVCAFSRKRIEEASCWCLVQQLREIINHKQRERERALGSLLFPPLHGKGEAGQPTTAGLHWLLKTFAARRVGIFLLHFSSFFFTSFGWCCCCCKTSFLNEKRRTRKSSAFPPSHSMTFSSSSYSLYQFFSGENALK